MGNAELRLFFRVKSRLKSMCFGFRIGVLSWSLLATLGWGEERISWKRVTLNDGFYAEGANFADINRDGHTDIISGPFWYAGPDWQEKRTIYEPKRFDIGGYSDHFFCYPYDFNGDGWPDVLVLGFPGKEARLYLNPGEREAERWEEHLVADVVDNESPVFTDITGDGKPELVCGQGGRYGWYAPDWSQPTAKWGFKPVTSDLKIARFTHGLGVGDVNGDGRLDLLEARHWWEAPADGSVESGEKGFKQHTFAAGIAGGAQMFAYDFDGDGRNDVATALAAHRYGVAVYLNRAGESGAQWERKMLVGEQPYENDYGVVFSQPHAMHLADIDGDGVMDLVTGKRYWAHNGKGDPDERGPRVVYWFQTKRDGKGGVEFVPHLIDAESGVGTDVQVGDVNGDKLLDIVIGNKAGVYVLLQQRVEVSVEVAALHEPKKLYGAGLQPQERYLTGGTAEQALAAMQLPAGFKAELIAAEPEVVQPIAMTFDERGRMWLVEGMTYPQRAEEGKGRDRILILEDSNGDGRFDQRKVFMENLNLVSGIEVGHSGVWIGAAPYLLFVPDRDGNDVPDGAAEILLDGWGYQDTHETLNSFLWGPDGWLYGVQGVFTHSKVGRPGATEEERVPLNACVWRFHPVRHEFEVFAHGTSNPWGLDFNEQGEFFITACVIPHLYHVVPGGRYQRQAGQHFNAFTYEDIKTIADHAHFAGDLRDNAHWGPRREGGLNNADTDMMGGGHAHCGLAIYQGPQFPAEWRGKLIFANLHGHRLVTDVLDPTRSSYVGRHGTDFLRSNDHWFISVTQKVGPDGSLYVTDWQDKTTCHRQLPELWDRSNGRVYRIRYEGLSQEVKQVAWPQGRFDLRQQADEGLIQLAMQGENEWFSRTARRVLVERAVAEPKRVVDWMKKGLVGGKGAGGVRSLWLAQSLAQLVPDPVVAQQVYQAVPGPNEGDETVRVQRVRQCRAEAEQAQLLILAQQDKAATVRREVASALQRLPLAARAEVAQALLQRKEDVEDPMIPLLIWYGIEPVVAADARRGLELAAVSLMPKVTGFIQRRMTESAEGWDLVFGQAMRTEDGAARLELVKGLVEARKRGVPQAQRPVGWVGTKALLQGEVLPELKQAVFELAILEREMDAVEQARVVLADGKAASVLREQALELLVRNQDAETAVILHGLLEAKAAQPSGLKTRAIQALTALPHENHAAVLLRVYERLNPTQKTEAVNALATQAAGARALVAAVRAGVVPRQQLSPFLLRQMQALKDAELDQAMREVLGDLNAPKPDLAAQMAKYRAILTTEALAGADAQAGRVVYAATCGACHKLFGEGQNVGPDITGSNRADLNYLLENVLDPNGVIGKEYQLNLFTMKDGRVMGGIVKEESAAAVKIAMMGGTEFLLAKAEIAKREVSKQSTMPEGLFDALPKEMLLNLVKYLQSGQGQEQAARAGVFEGESLKVTLTGGSSKIQGMGGFRDGQWSGDAHLWWTGGKVGDKLVASFEVDKAGKYRVLAVFTKARDYGIISVRLYGAATEIQDYDLYDPRVVDSGEEGLGEFELKQGVNHLEIEITGSNPAALPRQMMGLDYLRIE